MLYSQTKGVKQKYILCISGLVAYRQYIHNCSSLEDPYWLTAVSQLSAPPLPWACLRCGSPLLSLVSAMTHRRWAKLLSSDECLLTDSLSLSSSGLASVSLTLWIESAEIDSPYWSLNTALLASQPYTRRSRISRLAPVLKKMLSSYIKLESRSPEGSVFRHLITKS